MYQNAVNQQAAQQTGDMPALESLHSQLQQLVASFTAPLERIRDFHERLATGVTGKAAGAEGPRPVPAGTLGRIQEQMDTLAKLTSLAAHLANELERIG